MKTTFVSLTPKVIDTQTDTLVFFTADSKKFSNTLQALDKKAGGAIARAIESSGFNAKKGKQLLVSMPKAVASKRVLLVGTGKAAELKSLDIEKLGGALIKTFNATRSKGATLVVEQAGKGQVAEMAARLAYGALLGSYRFDKYFTKKTEDEKPTFTSLTVACEDSADAKKQFAALEKVAEGVFFTRNLVSEPANIIYPASFVEQCKALSKLGVDVKVLGVKEMQKLGMNALLGVGQGSTRESKLLVMQWNGSDDKKKAAPLAFVGKGVCFDTGGISIKPAAGMDEMKWDMGGAGVVAGLMMTLASRKAKVNVVGIAGLVENMPDGNAQRPGDVVVSMSGQTIEVLNTDAEGRLVLADALTYTQKNFKPRLIVDLATLTGAIIVALGSSRAGLFSNNDKLSNQLTAAGEAVGEPMWRLPLGEEYDKQINSDIADMQNIGKEREAGSITAAQFLQRFIENDTPWAHLDIAGVAWSKKGSDLAARGATGYGVRLLNELVKEYE